MSDALPFSVRRATPTDYPAVGEITVRAYVDDGHLPPGIAYVEVLADAESRDREAELWVASEEPSGRVLGSVTFAGEFLIMAGVYDQGWGYSVVVALGIVLAAMYTLRVISAILHVRPGPAVREEARDLRAGELGLVLPMILALLVLSAWPALISQSAFAGEELSGWSAYPPPPEETR